MENEISVYESPRFSGKVIRCIVCGKPKYFRPSFIKRFASKYCSHKCEGIDRKINPLESKSRRPHVGKKQILKSILIAEKILGRPLKTKELGNPEGEIVHHINRNNQDNRHCNLLICTQSYHIGLHNKMRRRKHNG